MINPYAPPSPDHGLTIDPALLREAQEQAKTLASGGAAIGSISVRLQKLGLDELPAAQVATEAVLKHAASENRVGTIILAVGTSMILAGYLCAFDFSGGLQGSILQIFLFLGGGFVMLVGMVKKAQTSRMVVEAKGFHITG